MDPTAIQTLREHIAGILATALTFGRLLTVPLLMLPPDIALCFKQAARVHHELKQLTDLYAQSLECDVLTLEMARRLADPERN